MTQRCAFVDDVDGTVLPAGADPTGWSELRVIDGQAVTALRHARSAGNLRTLLGQVGYPLGPGVAVTITALVPT